MISIMDVYLTRKVVSTKAAVALVRYADVYPADRAFYDAGAKAKVITFIPFSFFTGTHFRFTRDLFILVFSDL